MDAEHRAAKPAQARLIATLEALKPRPGFRQPPLRETLREFAAGWSALSRTARLALKLVEAGDRLTLAELRVVPSRMRMAGWSESESELALGIRLTQIECQRRHLSIKRTLLGDACLHALARRYERGRDRSDAAVLADLFALAEAYPERVLTLGDFRVPAGSGGAWIGECVRYTGRPFLTARTFVDAAAWHRLDIAGCAGGLSNRLSRRRPSMPKEHSDHRG